MFKSYTKIALRNILRNKIYSTINILGLSIGISAAMGIFLFVKSELSYDAYHDNKENIYRIIFTATENGNTSLQSYTPGPLAHALIKDFPQVVHTTRFWGNHHAVIKVEDKQFKEDDICFIDPDAWAMFTIPFVSGDPTLALKDPNSIVLRERLAEKYFGSADAIGKTVSIDGETFTVTGVLKESDHHSHLAYKILLPFAKVEEKMSWLQSWGTNAISTYIQLSPEASPAELENQSAEFGKRYGMSELQFILQPLQEIHLYSSHISDAFNTGKGSIAVVRIFSIIGFLLLFIACINFVNLATAKSSKRAKEIGLRKICGSSRLHIISQMLIEAILISIIACFIALGLAEIWLTLFNPMLSDKISIQWTDLLFALFISLGTGLIAGLYPAFYFARHQPVYVLSSLKSTSVKAALLRKALVLIQFVISITLISATLIVYMQRDFMLNKNLGFHKENVVCVPIQNDNERGKIDVVKQELLRDNHILGVAATTEANGSGTLTLNLIPRDDQSRYVHVELGSIDPDYIPTMGMQMASGRNFIAGNTSDFEEGVILNETACRQLGWNDPVGKEFNALEGAFINKSAIRVLGVVKDFHFNPLHSQIRPLAFFQVPSRYRHLVIRIKPGNVLKTIDNIKFVWSSVLPNSECAPWFLDERLDNEYRAELKMNKLLSYFALIVIVISCLGLFGLASFSVEQKIKEIGIRKVVGASVSQIIALLTKDFIKVVIIANLFAWPIAYYFMNKWLEDFAYRIEISWWMFALAGGIALVIALATVSIQAIKAATANPVESLKYE